MHKNRYLNLVIFFFTSLVFSQKEANIWYFGNQAGLDFNSGSPVPLLNGQINSQESCGSIADANGQLLFYTDGVTVYNRNHVAMSNGTGLMGHESSSQGATIVPKPGSATLFYIFTTDRERRPNGFRYTVVDMSLNGGLGDVTSEKNVLVFTPSLECIGAVSKANNVDYWIVVHGCDSNDFYSYSLTSSGFSNTPITSSVGATITGNGFNAAACMKISQSGTKLAFTSVTDIAQLFDFNNATGIVSNPITLSIESGELYGIEFSPDENVLYIGNAFNRIYQYDLLDANIPNSQLTLYSGIQTVGQFQLGPDGKIYIASYQSGKLGVINNPNVIGSGCNLQMDGLDLGGKLSRGGLPSFNRSFFNPSFKTENLCLGSSTQFTLTSTANVINTVWDFGDGSPTSNATNPSHVYANPGTYPVSVVISGTTASVTKSKSITILATPIIATTIANQSVCGTSNMNYDLSQFNNSILGGQSATQFGVAYFTSLTDLANHTNLLPINYGLQIGVQTFYTKIYNLANNKCYSSTSFTVTLYIQPLANKPSDNHICDDVLNDGVGQFALGNNTAQILGTQNSTQFTVTYHLNQNDAVTGSNDLALSYHNISNPQTIFARVENIQNQHCFATTSFQIGLNTMPIANPLQSLVECDDEANDGKASFNLSQQTAVLLGLQASANYTISYHLDLPDANSGINDLNPNYINIINPQMIYARIENKTSPACFSITSFPLIVKAAPVLNMDETYSNCEGNVITIAAPSGFSSYNWSNGTTTSSTSIATAGNYSLTVTKDYGTLSCPTTKNFTVFNSSKALITNIETRDWTDNQNMIIVQLSTDGKGDYEYSLDGINYQDSNIFEGLPSGHYTVYVNDKKGCGESTDDVFLLMYPKYFTPNGDGINDIWRIKFANIEPDMQLQIYDRYGKIITTFNGNDFGWDGFLNGKLQFADDYWFVVTRKTGKEFRGHFSLLR